MRTSSAPHVRAVEDLMLRLVMMVLCVTGLNVASTGCVVLAPGDGDGDGDGDGNTEGEGESGANPDLCSANNPCPTGQFCWNGLCAIGCTSDDNCDEDSYCNLNFCAPTEVPTCTSDASCGEGYACVLNYCSVIPAAPQGCQWDASLQDGCEGNELCIGDDPDNDIDGDCTQFPACPQDGDCPVGVAGAVCNEGFIPSKDRICLVGLCASQEDCPASLRCVVPGELGFCAAPLAAGFQCSADADCADGLTCEAVAPGFPSVCTDEDGGGGGGGGDGGDGGVGSLCDSDLDCDIEYSCIGGDEDFPGVCS